MKRRRVALLLLMTFLVALFYGAHTHASTNNWLSTSELEFKVRDPNISDTELPSTISGNGNVTCSSLSFKKRDGGFTASLSGIYKESSVSGCYNQTSIGLWDNNGYFNINGSELVAETKNSTGINTGFISFPNTDVFVSNVSNAPVGLYVWIDHLFTSVKTSSSLDGKITAKVTPQNQQAITDKSGNKLALMSNNFAISEDGTWLLADSPGKAVVRINTTTMEVLPFAQSFEYGNGIGAGLKMSISGDGRYASIYSKNYSFFKIYDLSTCAAVPNTITQPVTCSSKDLLTFVKSKIKDLSSVLQIRFVTNDSMNFYASYDAISAPKKGLFTLASPGNSLNATDYLAIGDSFSSGEGAHQYELGTDHENNKCHLSRVSYPYLIAKHMNYSSFHSVACSGAQRYKITEGKKNSSGKPPKSNDSNQYYLDPPETTLGIWIPGYRKQIEAVQKADPNIITLTLGGNDINFSSKIINCIKPGTCYPSYEDKKEVFNEIESLHSKLITVYKKLKAESRKATRIYVVGYPSIAYADGNCALNVRMNHDELVFAQTVVDQLNATIKSASASAGVHYIDVTDAFNGNRLCETNSNNVAMNGITAGNDIMNIIGNESFHPNQFGHELLTYKILDKSQNFTLGMPTAAVKTAPKIDETSPALANSQKTNRTIRKTTSDEITTPRKTKKSTKVKVSATNLNNSIAPNSNYTVTVGSNSTTTTSDSNGDINVDVDINPNDPAGSTNVNISGNDVTGTPISINDSIIIDGPEGDLDQDGVIDEKDSCLGVTNSNIDVDQDGIDDVCDELVGPAPTTPPTDTTPSADTTNSGGTDTSASNNPTTTDPITVTTSTTSNTLLSVEVAKQQNTITAQDTPAQTNSELQTTNKPELASSVLEVSAPLEHNKIKLSIPSDNLASQIVSSEGSNKFYKQDILEFINKYLPKTLAQNTLWVLLLLAILAKQLHKWQMDVKS